MFFLFSRFKGSWWQNYSPTKRFKILKALEKKMARKLHREPLTIDIHPDPNWNCFGVFEGTSTSQRILINENLVYKHELRFHALETIIHEGRHAYQYNIVNKKKIGFFNFKAKAWKKNWSGYFSANDDKTLYSMQAIERDAQKFTIDMFKSLSHKYKNESTFKNTYRAIIARYENSEINARKEYGLFYKSKINRLVENKKRH